MSGLQEHPQKAYYSLIISETKIKQKMSVWYTT